MRISELSRLSGLSIHRLRRYEALGLLQASRSEADYRDFPVQAVRDARFIALSRELGFRLDVLADVLPRFRAGTLGADEVRSRLLGRIREVDDLIAAQRAVRARLVAHVERLDRGEPAPRRRAGRGARGAPPLVDPEPSPFAQPKRIEIVPREP